MALWITALLLLAAGVLVYRFTRSEPTQEDYPRRGKAVDRGGPVLRPQLERLKASGRYWGVRLEHGGAGNACDAVLSLSGSSFAFEEAPPLPLPECAAMRCGCRYVGLEEQRNGTPRRQNADRRDKIRYEPRREARRKQADRRKINKAWTDQSSQ